MARNRINVKKQRNYRMSKVIAISDLHGDLPQIEPCDILCICGDITPLGLDRDREASWEWLNTVFIEWCNLVPAEQIIVIAGNHDFALEDMSLKEELEWVSKCYKLFYLKDSMVILGDIKIYGTPWCPRLSSWAFYQESDKLKEIFDNIPDCDILLTHTPPKYVNGVGEIRDVSRLKYELSSHGFPDHGCMELREAIKKKNIKYCFSGHIHSGNHKLTEWHGKKIANVSLKDESYDMTYEPLVIQI